MRSKNICLVFFVWVLAHAAEGKRGAGHCLPDFPGSARGAQRYDLTPRSPSGHTDRAQLLLCRCPFFVAQALTPLNLWQPPPPHLLLVWFLRAATLPFVLGCLLCSLCVPDLLAYCLPGHPCRTLCVRPAGFNLSVLGFTLESFGFSLVLACLSLHSYP